MNIETKLLSKDGVKIDLYLRENVSIDRSFLPTVIICPGGGYRMISHRESEPLAVAFLAKGYHAVVLTYPVLENINMISSFYLDMNKNLISEVYQLIGKNQSKWEMRSDMIFLLGYFAGGHLAALYATNWKNML
ncbi:hypothetical protein MYY11_002808 [Enterococcus faecium]|nr:hypothetical protein [Enterococcus faecium]